MAEKAVKYGSWGRNWGQKTALFCRNFLQHFSVPSILERLQLCYTLYAPKIRFLQSEWIEKRTSSSLLMLLFLSAFLNQLIKVTFVQLILCDSILFIFVLCVRFRVCHQNRTGALKQLPAGQDRKPPSRVFQSSIVRGTRRLAKSSARSRNELTSRPIASNSSFLR